MIFQIAGVVQYLFKRSSVATLCQEKNCLLRNIITFRPLDRVILAAPEMKSDILLSGRGLTPSKCSFVEVDGRRRCGEATCPPSDTASSIPLSCRGGSSERCHRKGPGSGHRELRVGASLSDAVSHVRTRSAGI